MIPKIIHFCWFGGCPKPKLVQICIASWKKYLPDYKFIEWNEDNFDFDKYPYTRQALEYKKYAYVSDVVRLYALKEYGGIYLDTDVEILKSLDIFLKETAFSGFENDNLLTTGLIGAEKNSKWVNDMLKYYDNRSFLNKENKPILTPNTLIITELMKEKGFIINNSYQKKEGYITYYPKDFFCPMDYVTQKIILTENTYSIHHFSGSWKPHSKKLKTSFLRIIVKLLSVNWL